MPKRLEQIHKKLRTDWTYIWQEFGNVLPTFKGLRGGQSKFS